MLEDVTLVVAEQAGIRVLLAHTLSSSAKYFYLEYGFHESPDRDVITCASLNDMTKYNYWPGVSAYSVFIAKR